MSEYIKPADTAKLVRAALKESFPSVKFSVRTSTYSGGASIRINWTDGPTQKQVDSIISAFKGAYFDGMIDYKGSNFAILDGRRVRFGADFIHTSRDFSEAFAQRILKRMGFSETRAELEAQEWWNMPYRGKLCIPGAEYVANVFNAVAQRTSDRLRIEHSKTLKRVAYAGDDGYSASHVAQGPNLRAVH